MRESSTCKPPSEVQPHRSIRGLGFLRAIPEQPDLENGESGARGTREQEKLKSFLPDALQTVHEPELFSVSASAIT